jgi:hypothetical protein
MSILGATNIRIIIKHNKTHTFCIVRNINTKQFVIIVNKRHFRTEHDAAIIFCLYYVFEPVMCSTHIVNMCI